MIGCSGEQSRELHRRLHQLVPPAVALHCWQGSWSHAATHLAGHSLLLLSALSQSLHLQQDDDAPGHQWNLYAQILKFCGQAARYGQSLALRVASPLAALPCALLLLLCSACSASVSRLFADRAAVADASLRRVAARERWSDVGEDEGAGATLIAGQRGREARTCAMVREGV